MEPINDTAFANETMAPESAPESAEDAVVRLLGAYVAARTMLDRLGANIDRLVLNQIAALRPDQGDCEADGGAEAPNAA